MSLNNISDKKKPEKILVIKLSALGDFVQALGPMKAIRNHHDRAHITLLTTEMFGGFGEKCGYFDSVTIDKKPKIFDPIGWINLRNTLIKENYSRIYDLQNNDRTSLYFRLFPKNKKPEWVGIAKNASHRNISSTRTKGHAFDGHKQTLSLAGINNIEIDNLKWIKEDLLEFGLRTPYILLVPGSAPQHPQKRWPYEKYGELANKLNDRGYQVILLGTNAEKTVNNAITSICKNALNLTGKTSLFQIAALAHGGAGAIGNDTGPMHMIAPTGCPCLTLFSGHSNPLRHAPNGRCVRTLQKYIIDELSVNEVFNTIINMIK